MRLQLHPHISKQKQPLISLLLYTFIAASSILHSASAASETAPAAAARSENALETLPATAPQAPSADHDNFHYIALQLHTDGWPSELPQRAARAQQVASELQLHFVGPVGQLPDYFLFASPKSTGGLERRSDHEQIVQETHHLERRCAAHDAVRWHEVQRPQRRLFKRTGIPAAPQTRIDRIRKLFGIHDPRFGDQWHLYNSEQPGHDMNVSGVWAQNVTGAGVTVGFIDDGIDFTHPDLRNAYVPSLSYDFNFNKPDPMPSMPEDTHGTRCAGEIAAAVNDVCGVGIAWNARIAGIRILSGDLTNANEAASINYGFNVTQVYSCSWGPRDDGMTMDAPPPMVAAAFRHGIEHGRGGLGSIFVFAAGNGGVRGDNCNFDGYTNSIYTITVAAMDRSEVHPSYSEQCPANLVSMWSGQGGLAGIVTSDWKEQCTDRHGGTSAAAPLAAGIYTLVMSVRPDLTWRDLQRLTVETAYQINPSAQDWERTAVGRLYSHKYGYGTLDTYAVIEAARKFVTLGPHTHLPVPTKIVNASVPPNESSFEATDSINITKEMVQDARLYRLEHITVTVDITHARRGDVSIHLVSPNGIRSRLIEGRPYDDKTNGFSNWTMMTVMHWDENPVGMWKLIVIDDKFPDKKGHWNSWSMKLWGESPKQNKTIATTAVSASTLTATAQSNSQLSSQSQSANGSKPKTESVASTKATSTKTVATKSTKEAVKKVIVASTTQQASKPTSVQDKSDATAETTSPLADTFDSIASFMNPDTLFMFISGITITIITVGVIYFAMRCGWFRSTKAYSPVAPTENRLQQVVTDQQTLLPKQAVDEMD